MNLRNLCIIAHVDHGKTTLVDHLLRQSGLFAAHQETADRVMDSMDLERERGITIQAKNASFSYRDHKVNIIDTPGHADFSAEVERIMGMVDGAVLLVDAAEGPLPQTRFVLEKALGRGLPLILVINKVDKPECADFIRVEQVVDQAFNLFIDLGASDEQADFPIVYACAKNGWCTRSQEEAMAAVSSGDTSELSMKPLLDLFVDYFPKPEILPGDDFTMMISNLGWSDYLGQLAIGKVLSGETRKGMKVFQYTQTTKKPCTLTGVFAYGGMERVETDALGAGDIGIIAGIPGVTIGDTISSNENRAPLDRIAVEEPTVSMTMMVNSGPLSGQEGEAIQSRKLRERLERETMYNVALKWEETDSPDCFRVKGRGELQFAILIEQMRREGFEFLVGKPEVVTSRDESGQLMEPLELVTLDLPQTHASEVTSMLQNRKGILQGYEEVGTFSTPGGPVARVRLQFEIPTRGVLGFRSHYLTATRGEGLMSSQVAGMTPWKGDLIHRTNGALVSDRNGKAVEYALMNLEDRGVLFIGPGVQVYEGMIIGEFNKDNDLNVNPCKEKKLTNVRAANAEILVTLKGIRKMSLENCIEWIDEDELIEVTPANVRLRKKILKSNMRSVVRK